MPLKLLNFDVLKFEFIIFALLFSRETVVKSLKKLATK